MNKMQNRHDYIEERDLSLLGSGIPMNPEDFEEYAGEDEMLLDGEFEYVEDVAEPYAGKIDVEAIISLTARLSHVLAQEVDMLGEMKVQDIATLQNEKLRLLDALEAHKKYIDRNPDLKKNLTDNECLELAQIVEIFQNIMQENHRQLLVAKEINSKVMSAITDAVNDASSNGTYNKRGGAAQRQTAMAMSYSSNA